MTAPYRGHWQTTRVFVDPAPRGGAGKAMVCPNHILIEVKATPHNCVCGRMAGLLPHPRSLENRKYTKYSPVFQTFG